MKNKLGLTEMQELTKKGSLTSYEVAKDCVDEIERLNPKINAYLTLNSKVLDEAKQKDKSQDKSGKLFGIPLAIKDNFLIKSIRTTASSKVLDDYIPQYTSTVVGRLLDAGALILGKTNMDAWAHGSSTERSDYGPTKNPWNFDRVPGGSSGGSAAATIADMCVASIGSETAGSVRGPAAWCGCVGLKPTYGRVSRYGVVAMGSSLDSPGPITKTVEDAAKILEVIAGQDPNDATTSPRPVEKYSDYLEKGVKGLKIGIAKEYLLPEMDKKVIDLIKDAAKVLEHLGAKIDYVSTMDPKYAISVYTVIQRSEVSSNLARYDGIRYGGSRELFGKEAKRRIMLGTFSLSAGYTDKYYKKAQKIRTLYIEDFNKIFSKYDLLIGPTLPGPALKLGESDNDPMFGELADVLAEPSSISGLPGISVPCGFVDGLPIGLDIFGPQFSEGVIISAANAFEKSTDWHKARPKL